MGIISVLGSISDGPRKRDQYVTLTFDPVDSVGLQGFVSQLKDLPQVRRYPAQLESRAVDEFVHIVKQICNHNVIGIPDIDAEEDYR